MLPLIEANAGVLHETEESILGCFSVLIFALELVTKLLHHFFEQGEDLLLGLLASTLLVGNGSLESARLVGKMLLQSGDIRLTISRLLLDLLLQFREIGRQTLANVRD